MKIADGSGRTLAAEGDEVAEVCDAEACKRHHGIVFGGTIDPDQTIFRPHLGGEIGEPVFVLSKLAGDESEGSDGMDLVELRGHAAKAIPGFGQFQ